MDNVELSVAAAFPCLNKLSGRHDVRRRPLCSYPNLIHSGTGANLKVLFLLLLLVIFHFAGNGRRPFRLGHSRQLKRKWPCRCFYLLHEICCFCVVPSEQLFFFLFLPPVGTGISSIENLLITYLSLALFKGGGFLRRRRRRRRLFEKQTEKCFCRAPEFRTKGVRNPPFVL